MDRIQRAKTVDQLTQSMPSIVNKYVHVLDKEDPRRHFLAPEMFIKRFWVSDVMEYLVGTSEETENKVLTQLSRSWLNGGKSANDVFVILEMKGDRHDALKGIKYKALMMYIGLKEGSYEWLKIYETLKDGYGDDINYAFMLLD